MLTIYVWDWGTRSVTLLTAQVCLNISCLLDQAGNLIRVCVRIAHQLPQHLEWEVRSFSSTVNATLWFKKVLTINIVAIDRNIEHWERMLSWWAHPLQELDDSLLLVLVCSRQLIEPELKLRPSVLKHPTVLQHLNRSQHIESSPHFVALRLCFCYIIKRSLSKFV